MSQFDEEKAGLLRFLQAFERHANGEFELTAIDDTEEESYTTGMSLEQVVEEASQTDMSYLHFTNHQCVRHWVMLVWGNSPEELIADHTLGDGFDEIVDKATAEAWPEED